MFSKSKGNGVDPLDIIAQGYGADALRTYLMFAGPLELWVRWDPQGVPGMRWIAGHHRQGLVLVEQLHG